MPRRVKLPDGQVVNFPDDVTDQEISEFLNQSTAEAPPVEAATPLDPRAQMTADAKRQILGATYDREPAPVSDVITEQMPKQMLMGAALSGAGQLLSKIPVGRVLSAGMAGAKAAAAKTPIIGPPVRAGLKAAAQSWKGSPTPSAAPPASVSGAPPVAAPAAPAPPAAAPMSSVRLTAEESKALRALVKQGYDEADVVKAIVQQRPAAAPPPNVAGKPSLSAAETKEFQRLLGRGKSPEEAYHLIASQRQMIQAKGLPTSEQTRQAVYDRNATGRWD